MAKKKAKKKIKKVSKKELKKVKGGVGLVEKFNEFTGGKDEGGLDVNVAGTMGGGKFVGAAFRIKF